MMNPRGDIRIDPGSLETHGGESAVQFVIVHSEWDLTVAVLQRAADLVAGLNASILLVAVQTVPFPASFASASSSHAHLAAELAELAGQCSLPVTPHIVMARDRDEGFRFLLKEESTVLIGTKKRAWETREERLAHLLAESGHQVILFHVAGAPRRERG